MTPLALLAVCALLLQGVAVPAITRPGSSVAATPPLPASAAAISATAIPSAPPASPSIVPSASQFPESTASVIPSFPTHEDSNATDIHNGTLPGENQNKEGILSSPARIVLVVVVPVIGGVALILAVAVGIWKFRRWQRNQVTDRSELIDAYVYSHTHSAMDWLTLEYSQPRDSREGNSEAENVQNNP